MNIKTFLIFFILFSIGIGLAFSAGKVSHNILTISQLKASIEELQSNVQHLEQELAKKTGIEIKAKFQPIPETEQAFVKAEAWLKQGDLARAGLYFSHGISQTPGNWTHINRYQQSVLDYCRQRRDEGNYELALNVLNDMNTFMRTQALYVSVQDIEKLQQALTDLAQLKQSIIDKITQANQTETLQWVKTLLNQTEQLLADNPHTDNLDKITLHLKALKDNLFALQSIDENVIKQNESLKMAHKITQLENTIAMFEQQLSTAKETNTLSMLVQQATRFINNAKNEPVQSDFVLYYLTSAESIIRQLVLVKPERTKMQIAALSKQLEQAKQDIAKQQSERVWQEIEQAFKPITKIEEQIEEQIKAQEVIEQLLQFRQLLAEKAGKMSSVELLEKAQARMKEVNTQITAWQAKQTREYERWAIKKITTFYSKYKNELGVGTDENRVYHGMKEFLGHIDIRYLSSPAQTAYNEAFQKFYAEIDDDQKIRLSSELTLKNKKLLSDF